MNKPFKQDWRYAQANREALLTLGAYGLYFVCGTRAPTGSATATRKGMTTSSASPHGSS